MDSIPNAGLLYFRGVLGSEDLVVTAAEGLRDVLFAHAYNCEKTRGFRRYAKRILAVGLVVQEGEAHQVRRRAVGPAFQARNVDGLQSLLCARSQRLGSVLQSHVRGGEVVADICDWATGFTPDIACVVGFGEAFGLIESGTFIRSWKHVRLFLLI
ncbi:cytochrome p450 [Paraphaeosphaeria sporulosa]